MTGSGKAVLVIGGGMAGAAAACELARAGHSVELVERSAGPHDKVCGEFLSWETQADLRPLGVDARALGAAAIDRVRLIDGRRTAERALPFQGLSLSRRVLDEALLGEAARAGAIVRRGMAVRGLEVCGGIARLVGEADAAPRTIVLATGKHTLRGAARDAAASGLIGFKMYFRLSGGAASRLARRVELHLFEGGYAGVEPVEDDRANLTLLVREDAYAACGGQWPVLLERLCADNRSLGDLLDGAAAVWERPLSIAGIPYGFAHRAGAGDPANVYRVGDQLAVVPSLTGDGMAIALRSGIEAARAIHDGVPAAVFHAGYRAASRRQMLAAGWMAAALQNRWARPVLSWAACRLPRLIDTAVDLTRISRHPARCLSSAA